MAEQFDDKDVRMQAAQLILSGKSLKEAELGDDMRGKLKDFFAQQAGITAPVGNPAKKENEFREFCVEHSDFLKTLKGQHLQMRAALERVGISIEGMPSWEAIKAGLIPEVLDKTLKMQKPTLIMVPPTTRQSKVAAIDKYPAKDQKRDTAAYELQDVNLWNGGKDKTENRWKVAIVEGAEHVTPDPEITGGRKTNYQMAKAYVKKYADQGLDVINDADTYLSLMLKALAEGKPVDPERSSTVLNAKNAEETSILAYGHWHNDRVLLGSADPGCSPSSLLPRSLMWVDVQA